MKERDKWKDFLLPYKFKLDELKTKVNIINEEKYMDGYNPIEHIKCRIKKPMDIIGKLKRKNLPVTIKSARENLNDVAGLRIICLFVSDIYTLFGLIKNQQDIEIIEIKDYIQFPKANGYRSLHVIIQTPITFSTVKEKINVEIQLRTLAMDFWASMEHKIHYESNEEIPSYLKTGLKEAADTAQQLDQKMKTIQEKIQVRKGMDTDTLLLH